ncbi:MAG: 50S ribosomal protein L9 [Verrucomicrobia bacterium]|nr:50S ribosomal protein L9 [Verrucomicrobiota bacterium]MCH8510132.1 50S ribosomal protein L9 [Kiritimatiellia bacterium]
MAKELILLQDVDGLGIVGEVVTVAEGYARNYLIPQGKATKVTDKMKEHLAEARVKREAELREAKQQAEVTAESLKDAKITITVRTSGEGRLYGSVSESDVAKAGKAAKLPFTEEQVAMGAPIRQLGNYDVRIRLHRDVSVNIKVEVVSEEEE